MLLRSSLQKNTNWSRSMPLNGWNRSSLHSDTYKENLDGCIRRQFMASSLLVLFQLRTACHSVSEQQRRIQGRMPEVQSRNGKNTEGATPRHHRALCSQGTGTCPYDLSLRGSLQLNGITTEWLRWNRLHKTISRSHTLNNRLVTPDILHERPPTNTGKPYPMVTRACRWSLFLFRRSGKSNPNQ